jgi:energy-coupling factor transporter transmembrane protein EcfT
LILGLSQGWNAGGLACTRLVTLILGPWVLFQSTTPEQLRNAFAWARLPPSFIFTFTTSVSFMEVLGPVIAELRLNLRLRGVSPRHLGALLLAAVVEVFRQANDLALSLETRGYSPRSARRVRGLRWRLPDTLLLLVGLCLTTASFGLPGS